LEGPIVFAAVRLFLSLTIAASLAPAFARDFQQTGLRIAHFSSDARDVGFVLDQTGPLPRVRIDGDGEILAGWWKSAAGGDRILVRDDGVLILRQNVAGGITLFTPQYPMGVPVTLDRPAMPLEGPPPPIDTVRDTAIEGSAAARNVLGQTIAFEADWALAANDAGLRAILFDAVQNTNAAFRMIAADPQARAAVVRHLRGVRYARGARPGIARQRTIAVTSYTLEYGVASRPSSHRIAHEIKLQFR
jgi:hypothetical protein